MDWPLSGKASVKHERNDVNITYDANIFPRETNKIIFTGRIKKKLLAVVCDGNGNMRFDLIQSPAQRIKEFAKLRKDGVITDEDFQKKKKEILENDDAGSYSE